MECFSCKRKPIFPGEGRVADGSWPADANLPEEARDKWFCCFKCYDFVVRKHVRSDKEAP